MGTRMRPKDQVTTPTTGFERSADHRGRRRKARGANHGESCKSHHQIDMGDATRSTTRRGQQMGKAPYIIGGNGGGANHGRVGQGARRGEGGKQVVQHGQRDGRLERTAHRGGGSRRVRHHHRRQRSKGRDATAVAAGMRNHRRGTRRSGTHGLRGLAANGQGTADGRQRRCGHDDRVGKLEMGTIVIGRSKMGSQNGRRRHGHSLTGRRSCVRYDTVQRRPEGREPSTPRATFLYTLLQRVGEGPTATKDGGTATTKEAKDSVDDDMRRRRGMDATCRGNDANDQHEHHGHDGRPRRQRRAGYLQCRQRRRGTAG